MSAGEKTSLAQALSQLTKRYDRLFDTPFPYSMGFHQKPTDGALHAEWQMHAHSAAPGSATIRKFMVGFEDARLSAARPHARGRGGEAEGGGCYRTAEHQLPAIRMGESPGSST